MRLYSKRQGQHVCKRYGIVCVFSSGGTFRVINGNTVATTMCTGNLRSGTELLFLGIKKKDKKITLRSLTYYGINLFFALGAIAGAIATKFLDVKSIFYCKRTACNSFYNDVQTKRKY